MTTTDLDLSVTLADIRHQLDAVSGDIDTFIAHVNAVLGLLPEAVAHAAIAQVDGGLARPFALTRNEIDRLLGYAGRPSALQAAGDIWARDVARLVSGVAATSNVSIMAAEDQWSGQAAKAYRAVIPLQAAALTALTAAATDANTILHDYAAALNSFWTTIATALASFAAGVLAVALGVLLAESVIPAVLAAVGAVTAFSTAVEKASNAFSTVNAKQAADVVTLNNRTYNNNAFPGGNWPVSTHDLRDASITDGDGTDWSLSP